MSKVMRRTIQHAGTIIAMTIVFPLGFCVMSGVFIFTEAWVVRVAVGIACQGGDMYTDS